jgi:hypothetical protein
MGMAHEHKLEKISHGLKHREEGFTNRKEIATWAKSITSRENPISELR